MAGYWIKFDTATPDKPEVWSIAERLQIDPDAVVGKLLRIWSWFDDHTENGNAPSVTKSLLDRRVGVTGFCDAMISAGWMCEEGSGVTIPNFERHNGKTAKTRCLTANRVAKHKTATQKGNAPANAASVSDALPRAETETEENILSLSHHDKTLNLNPEILKAWDRWCQFRLAIDGRLPDPISSEANLLELERRGPTKAVLDIEFSILKRAKTIRDSDNDYDKRAMGNSSGSSRPQRKKVTI